MTIHTVVVGLKDDERATICSAFERMLISPCVLGVDGEAREKLLASNFDLAVVGYEAEGCGLPLAVQLRAGRDTKAARPDCIVIADRMCAALSNAARDLGLLAVLQRPVSSKDLAVAVEAHLRHRNR